MKSKYLIGIGLTIAGGLGIVSGMGLPGAIAITIGVGCVGYELMNSRETPNRRLASSDDINQEKRALIEDKFQIAVNDYYYIQEAIKKIKDNDLRVQLMKMQGIANSMLSFMEKNPDRVPLAYKFIDYYQSTAAQLTKKFIELEQSGLYSEEINRIMNHTKETLDSFDEAYEEQFEKMMMDNLMDMHAELKVADDMLKEAGISNSNPSTSHPNYTFSKNLGTKVLKQPIQRRQHYMTTATDEFSIKKLLKWGMFYPYSNTPEYNLELMKRYRYGLALVSLLLGNWGVNRLLKGHPISALISFIFSFTLIPGILGIIEGIKLLNMSDNDFFNKYYLEKFDK